MRLESSIDAARLGYSRPTWASSFPLRRRRVYLSDPAGRRGNIVSDVLDGLAQQDRPTECMTCRRQAPSATHDHRSAGEVAAEGIGRAFEAPD